MKKTLFFIVITLGLSLGFSGGIFAHPGNTDLGGGHYCWTNCASWGYSYGEYHYHNVSEAACLAWIPTAKETKKKLDLMMTNIFMQQISPNLGSIPGFSGMTLEGAQKIETVHMNGLNNLSASVRILQDKWQAMEAGCSPYYTKTENGDYVTKINISDFGQTSVLNLPDTASQFNFAVKETKKAILITWDKPNNSNIDYYEYTLSYFQLDLGMHEYEWIKSKIYDTKKSYNRIPARKGEMRYFYLRSVDKKGNRSPLQMYKIQF